MERISLSQASPKMSLSSVFMRVKKLSPTRDQRRQAHLPADFDAVSQVAEGKHEQQRTRFNAQVAEIEDLGLC